MQPRRRSASRIPILQRPHVPELSEDRILLRQDHMVHERRRGALVVKPIRSPRRRSHWCQVGDETAPRRPTRRD
jgi:hypothetical protein